MSQKSMQEREVAEDQARQEQAAGAMDAASISWWSWRPGSKPRNTLLLGGLLSLLALLFISIGLLTLISGILDSYSAPLQLPGIVTGHSKNAIDGLPRLTIRLHEAHFPSSVSPIVTNTLFQTLSERDALVLDYSPRLHILYALEYKGYRYMLPDSSIAGSLFGSLALLLLGAILFPYPALLSYWSWADLAPFSKNQQCRCTMKAKVIALRTAAPKRASRSGMLPMITHAWHGVALQPVDATSSRPVLTFSIPFEMFRSLKKGELITITYSLQLHHVYRMEKSE